MASRHSRRCAVPLMVAISAFFGMKVTIMRLGDMKATIRDTAGGSSHSMVNATAITSTPNAA